MLNPQRNDSAKSSKTRIQVRNEARILDAAQTVFAEHGFRGATVEDAGLVTSLNPGLGAHSRIAACQVQHTSLGAKLALDTCLTGLVSLAKK